MSQHQYTGRHNGGKVTVTMGYDRPLDYVFCTVQAANGIMLYSNLSDENAGTDQQDLDYYRDVLKGMKIAVPESMFKEVAKDQLKQVGNRNVTHRFEPKP